MHSWFTQKLNEMIGLAHYCQYPVLKAHFILAQKAVDEIYDKPTKGGVGLAQLLPLLASEAENDGHSAVAGHLRDAMDALLDETKNPKKYWKLISARRAICRGSSLKKTCLRSIG